MASKHILEFEKPIIALENKIAEMKNLSAELDISFEISELEKKVETLKIDIYRNLTRWQRVQLARHPERPITLDYISNIFTDFNELHGDRKFKDDPAIVGGMAFLGDSSVMVMGHQKGRDTKSNIYRNFGMPNPEGYRKASRLFDLAEKYNKPIITFLDTPGAYPGIEAEERGQAEAIASNLMQMSSLTVPIIVVIIGEGASGGALGIGIGDRILMLENSWYSVIAPESCSSILWRSREFKEQAAEALKLSSSDLLEHNIVDRIIDEPVGGTHKDPQQIFKLLKDILIEELSVLSKMDRDKLIEARRNKFYNMGVWVD